MRHTAWSLLLGPALMLSASCGGAALPEAERRQAARAVTAAETMEASRYPSAALHLKMAKDEIATAERLIEDGANAAARRALLRAQKDAELALELTRSEAARNEADQALNRARALQARANLQQ